MTGNPTPTGRLVSVNVGLPRAVERKGRAVAQSISFVYAPEGGPVKGEDAPLGDWLPVYAKALAAPAPRSVPPFLARFATRIAQGD